MIDDWFHATQHQFWLLLLTIYLNADGRFKINLLVFHLMRIELGKQHLSSAANGQLRDNVDDNPVKSNPPHPLF
jgi:hypothetical protein